MNYIWVVLGAASRLPRYSSINKYKIVEWLNTRDHSQFRVFRLRENQVDGHIEVCVSCLLDNPHKSAEKRGHE